MAGAGSKRTVGYGQFAPVFGDVEANAATVERLARGAVLADLLVFPELALTGYDFRDASEARSLAEPFGEGPSCRLAARIARECDLTFVIGFAERAPEGLYNACVLARPDGTLARYRKIHLFSRETTIFTPGDRAPEVVDTPAGRVGMMICFDWQFPEVARLLALAGAQILAHPANLIFPYCQRTMVGRSIENRVHSVTANRTGTESRAGRTLAFTGRSQVLDARGEVLVQAPAEGEHVGLGEVDLAQADEKHVTPENHLFAARRPELYRGLSERRPCPS